VRAHLASGRELDASSLHSGTCTRQRKLRSSLRPPPERDPPDSGRSSIATASSIHVHFNPLVRALDDSHPRRKSATSICWSRQLPERIHMLRGARLVLTDSGGPAGRSTEFGVPVLVMRLKTERPEAIRRWRPGGMVGVRTRIGSSASGHRPSCPTVGNATRHSTAQSLFGDGRASERIADVRTKRR